MKHHCLAVVCAGMPPKNSARGRGKGKALLRRPARTRQVPARYQDQTEPKEQAESEASEEDTDCGDEAEHGLAAQLAATNARLDSLTRLIEQSAAGPSAQVHPVGPSLPPSQAIMGGALDSLIEAGSNRGEPYNQDMSAYLTLGSTLDTKIKAKIWARQYVDLGTLSPPTNEHVSFSFNAKEGALTLAPTKSNTSLNIFSWLRLFSTYAAVYLERYPEEAPNMFSYMVNILDLQKKYPGAAWCNYDIRFRQLKSHCEINRAHNSLPWQVTNYQLVLDVLHTDNPLVARPVHGRRDTTQKPFPAAAPSGTTTATGFCYQFNQPKGCQRQQCRYRHDCQVCGKRGHPAVRCVSAKRDSTNSTHMSGST